MAEWRDMTWNGPDRRFGCSMYCIVCGFPSRRQRFPRHHDRPGWRVGEKAARERRRNNASSQVRESGVQEAVTVSSWPGRDRD